MDYTMGCIITALVMYWLGDADGYIVVGWISGAIVLAAIKGAINIRTGD